MDILLPLSIVMGLIGYGLIARWYLWPWILRQPKTEALIVLILPHVFRYVGLAFLTSHNNTPYLNFLNLDSEKQKKAEFEKSGFLNISFKTT